METAGAGAFAGFGRMLSEASRADIAVVPDLRDVGKPALGGELGMDRGFSEVRKFFKALHKLEIDELVDGEADAGADLPPEAELELGMQGALDEVCNDGQPTSLVVLDFPDGRELVPADGDHVSVLVGIVIGAKRAIKTEESWGGSGSDAEVEVGGLCADGHLSDLLGFEVDNVIDAQEVEIVIAEERQQGSLVRVLEAEAGPGSELLEDLELGLNPVRWI